MLLSLRLRCLRLCGPRAARRGCAAALSGLMCAAAAAQGEPASNVPAATALPELTNTATRTDRPLDAVPATVTTVRAAETEARAVRDLRDLFRHEVDLSVRAASPRFSAALASTGRAGNEGLNVRGLEGNQVLLLVDGVRVPQAFSFGAFAVGRGDYLFIEASQSAEVLRGPASTQFGSDGLAGALALRTIEPTDLLRPGAARAAFARAAGSTLDDSGSLTAAGAWRSAALSLLLLASHRRGSETTTQGDNEALDARRTAPNPLDYEQTGALAKLRVALGAAHRVGGTLETLHRRTTVEVFSARSTPPPPPAALPATAVLDLDARDRIDRTRGSLEWRFEDLQAGLVQQAEAHLYVQDARNRQDAFEDRNIAADRVRRGSYSERTTGMSVQAQASLATPVTQRLSAGVDASEAAIRSVRDGTVPPAGESFPVRAFPDTRYRLVGAFVQSEIETASLTVIPALRLDHFRLAPSQEGFVGGSVVALSDQALTPRLGVVWRAHQLVQPYAQWARGFRAPAPGQVNNGFTNVTAFYRSVGNPDLKPERAQSMELGLRGRAGGARWQLAAYDNRYLDFISQEQVGGSFTAADPAIFQFVNLARARIRGAEVRASWTPATGWQLRAAAAAVRGRTEREGASSPLVSEEPDKASLGLRHERGSWSWRADVLHVRAKDPARTPAAAGGVPAFAPPGHTVVDLGTSWRAGSTFTLHLNVDNVFDRTYWRYSDVRGLADTSPVKSAFTAAGRTLSAVLRWDL